MARPEVGRELNYKINILVAEVFVRENEIMKKLAFITFALIAGVGKAVEINEVPTKWRLESYGEKNVALWFTPSTCQSGLLGLPTTATLAEHNRLYATVLAAKIAQTKILITYNVVGSNCVILSYGLSEG